MTQTRGVTRKLLGTAAHLLAAAVLLRAAPVLAHDRSPERTIWPGTPPDARVVSGPEYRKTIATPLVAGRPWTEVGRVSRPTLTFFPAHGRRSRTAIVVFPGGGYDVLAIDLEGTEVCAWLTARGVTCILAKYRVAGPEHYGPGAPYPKSGPYPESPIALEDAQRTIRLVRHAATRWGIDRHRIGALGFSAGAHLALATGVYFSKDLYRAVDDADRESARPDFVVAIYPGHLSLSAARWDAAQGGKISVRARGIQAPLQDLQLNPAMVVSKATPPVFLVQTQDDDVDDVDDALAYYIAAKNAHVPAELHLFTHGGHAFGVRRTDQPITDWPTLMRGWLMSLGLLR